MEQQYSSPQMDICRANPVLRQFHGPGLSAFKKSERQYIKVPDTKSIGCSVALDEAAKGEYPNDNRWDYALEYDGFTSFIEIHPASTSEIDCMIQKVGFLKKWIHEKAPEIFNLPHKDKGARQFFWVSSGKTDLRISPGSRQARKLALNHIKPVGKIWEYSKIFK